MKATFLYGADGKIDRISIPLDGATSEIVFPRSNAPGASRSKPDSSFRTA
jgi:hypothetical protein